MRSLGHAVAVCAFAGATLAGDLESARDRQDRTALEQKIAELSIFAAKQPNTPELQYRLALAQSYFAEVALELRDKLQAKTAAEAGIRAAQRAVALNAGFAEYHRILGTLCGQVIPANVISGLKYGKCAQDSINKAIELDPKSSLAYMGRGVGNFYLPEALGGGPELAVKDFRKAIQFNGRNADAFLWMGIALRKLNRNAEARQAFQRSLELNPNRLWAKLQLEKTPAQ